MQCKFTKEWLKNNQVPFEEKDTSKNVDDLNAVRAMGFQSLPVVIIEGHDPFYGFNPDLLEDALD